MFRKKISWLETRRLDDWSWISRIHLEGLISSYFPFYTMASNSKIKYKFSCSSLCTVFQSLTSSSRLCACGTEPPPALAPHWPLTSSPEIGTLCVNLQKKQSKSAKNTDVHWVHTKQLRVQNIIVRCPWRRNAYLSCSHFLLEQCRTGFRYYSVSLAEQRVLCGVCGLVCDKKLISHQL